jgi:hypothetical protein
VFSSTKFDKHFLIYGIFLKKHGSAWAKPIFFSPSKLPDFTAQRSHNIGQAGYHPRSTNDILSLRF